MTLCEKLHSMQLSLDNMCVESERRFLDASKRSHRETPLLVRLQALSDKNVGGRLVQGALGMTVRELDNFGR